jgi:hypothetical protein
MLFENYKIKFETYKGTFLLKHTFAVWKLVYVNGSL